MRAWIFVILIIGLGCGRKDVNRRGEIKLRGERPVSLTGKDVGERLQEGVASWYGDPYHGRRTANGEVYDMWSLTAAHKTLPFGTLVRVEARDNGRSVVVRINDRGPFIRGRIIDLSRRAARDLGVEGAGVAQVRLYLAGEAAPSTPRLREGGFWTIQVGSFGERSRAERMAARLGDFGEARIERSGGMYRVRLGRYTSKAAAGEVATGLYEQELPVWILYVD